MAGGPATSPDSRHSADDTSPRGSRKVSTYGGSRAWSENEETYLLEARQSKTPYKHIANHLQKTELACRLHFHQLAYGTKRKRRSPSASSATTTQGSRNASSHATDRRHVSQRSIDSTTSRLSTEHQVNGQGPPLMYIRAISPPNSPPPAQRRRLARSESPPHMESLSVPHATLQAATTQIPSSRTFSPFPQHPPFATNTSPFPRPSASPSAFSHQSFTSAPSLLPPHTLGGTEEYPPALETSRRYSHHSNTAPPSFDATTASIIDPQRLSGIYTRNRTSFWSQISREYGGNISPTALEAAFLRQGAGSPTGSLPTPPNRSPVMAALATDGEEKEFQSRKERAESYRRSASAEGGGSCSIANLLTEDREIWQRRRTT